MTDDLHPYRTEPDPAFADRLERELLDRLASPSNSTDEDLPEDVQIVRLADPGQPAVEQERARSARWLAAAAVVVLVVAAIALLRNAGGDDAPVDVVPTTTTLPPLTDTPSTGSIVTADGHGWPAGAVAPPRVEEAGIPEDTHAWTDFDPDTGSFLYAEYFFGYEVWVVGEDGEEEANFDCPTSDCGGAVFGPGTDEVTAVVPDATCTGPNNCDHGPVVPERVRIGAWDGTVRGSVDISAAFTRDGNGTRPRLGTLAWSPDGSRLAVSTEPEGDQPENSCDPLGGQCVAEVWIFERDGGEPQLVYTADSPHPEDAENGEPPLVGDLAWSPDGRTLAMSVTSPPTGATWPTLVAIRFEPGEPGRAEVLHTYDDVVPAGTPLLPWQYNRFAFAWSPDGTRIAVTSGGGGLGGNPGVAEIAADDGRVLSRHPGDPGRRDPSGNYGLAWIP